MLLVSWHLMSLVISLPAGAVGLVGHRLVWFGREFPFQRALRMLVVFRLLFPPIVHPLEQQVSYLLIAVGGSSSIQMRFLCTLPFLTRFIVPTCCVFSFLHYFHTLCGVCLGTLCGDWY